MITKSWLSLDLLQCIAKHKHISCVEFSMFQEHCRVNCNYIYYIKKVVYTMGRLTVTILCLHVLVTDIYSSIIMAI